MNDSENLSRNLGTGWRHTETTVAEEAEVALVRWPRLREALQQRAAAPPPQGAPAHG